eukprot:g8997.t1
MATAAVLGVDKVPAWFAELVGRRVEDEVNTYDEYIMLHLQQRFQECEANFQEGMLESEKKMAQQLALQRQSDQAAIDARIQDAIGKALAALETTKSATGDVGTTANGSRSQSGNTNGAGAQEPVSPGEAGKEDGFTDALHKLEAATLMMESKLNLVEKETEERISEAEARILKQERSFAAKTANETQNIVKMIEDRHRFANFEKQRADHGEKLKELDKKLHEELGRLRKEQAVVEAVDKKKPAAPAASAPTSNTGTSSFGVDEQALTKKITQLENDVGKLLGGVDDRLQSIADQLAQRQAEAFEILSQTTNEQVYNLTQAQILARGTFLRAESQTEETERAHISVQDADDKARGILKKLLKTSSGGEVAGGRTALISARPKTKRARRGAEGEAPRAEQIAEGEADESGNASSATSSDHQLESDRNNESRLGTMVARIEVTDSPRTTTRPAEGSETEVAVGHAKASVRSSAADRARQSSSEDARRMNQQMMLMMLGGGADEGGSQTEGNSYSQYSNNLGEYTAVPEWRLGSNLSGMSQVSVRSDGNGNGNGNDHGNGEMKASAHQAAKERIKASAVLSKNSPSPPTSPTDGSENGVGFVQQEKKVRARSMADEAMRRFRAFDTASSMSSDEDAERIRSTVEALEPVLNAAIDDRVRTQLDQERLRTLEREKQLLVALKSRNLGTTVGPAVYPYPFEGVEMQEEKHGGIGGLAPYESRGISARSSKQRITTQPTRGQLTTARTRSSSSFRSRSAGPTASRRDGQEQESGDGAVEMKSRNFLRPGVDAAGGVDVIPGTASFAKITSREMGPAPPIDVVGRTSVGREETTRSGPDADQRLTNVLLRHTQPRRDANSSSIVDARPNVDPKKLSAEEKQAPQESSTDSLAADATKELLKEAADRLTQGLTGEAGEFVAGETNMVHLVDNVEETATPDRAQMKAEKMEQLKRQLAASYKLNLPTRSFSDEASNSLSRARPGDQQHEHVEEEKPPLLVEPSTSLSPDASLKDVIAKVPPSWDAIQEFVNTEIEEAQLQVAEAVEAALKQEREVTAARISEQVAGVDAKLGAVAATLGQRVDAAQEDVNKVREEQREAENEKLLAQPMLTALNQELQPAARNSLLERAEQEIDNLRTLADAMQRRIMDLESQSEMLQKKLDDKAEELRGTNAATKARLSALEQENADSEKQFTKRLDSVVAKIGDDRGDAGAAGAAAAALPGPGVADEPLKFADQSGRVSVLEENLSALRDTIADLRSEVRNAVEIAAPVAEERANHRSQMNDVAAKVARLEAKLRARDTLARESVGDARALSRSVGRLKQAVDAQKAAANSEKEQQKRDDQRGSKPSRRASELAQSVARASQRMLGLGPGAVDSEDERGGTENGPAADPDLAVASRDGKQKGVSAAPASGADDRSASPPTDGRDLSLEQDTDKRLTELEGLVKRRIAALEKKNEDLDEKHGEFERRQKDFMRKQGELEAKVLAAESAPSPSTSLNVAGLTTQDGGQLQIKPLMNADQEKDAAISRRTEREAVLSATSSAAPAFVDDNPQSQSSQPKLTVVSPTSTRFSVWAREHASRGQKTRDQILDSVLDPGGPGPDAVEAPKDENKSANEHAEVDDERTTGEKQKKEQIKDEDGGRGGESDDHEQQKDKESRLLAKRLATQLEIEQDSMRQVLSRAAEQFDDLAQLNDDLRGEMLNLRAEFADRFRRLESDLAGAARRSEVEAVQSWKRELKGAKSKSGTSGRPDGTPQEGAPVETVAPPAPAAKDGTTIDDEIGDGNYGDAGSGGDAATGVDGVETERETARAAPSTTLRPAPEVEEAIRKMEDRLFDDLAKEKKSVEGLRKQMRAFTHEFVDQVDSHMKALADQLTHCEGEIGELDKINADLKQRVYELEHNSLPERLHKLESLVDAQLRNTVASGRSGTKPPDKSTQSQSSQSLLQDQKEKSTTSGALQQPAPLAMEAVGTASASAGAPTATEDAADLPGSWEEAFRQQQEMLDKLAADLRGMEAKTDKMDDRFSSYMTRGTMDAEGLMDMLPERRILKTTAAGAGGEAADAAFRDETQLELKNLKDRASRRDKQMQDLTGENLARILKLEAGLQKLDRRTPPFPFHFDLKKHNEQMSMLRRAVLGLAAKVDDVTEHIAAVAVEGAVNNAARDSSTSSSASVRDTTTTEADVQSRTMISAQFDDIGSDMPRSTAGAESTVPQWTSVGRLQSAASKKLLTAEDARRTEVLHEGMAKNSLRALLDDEQNKEQEEDVRVEPENDQKQTERKIKKAVSFKTDADPEAAALPTAAEMSEKIRKLDEQIAVLVRKIDDAGRATTEAPGVSIPAGPEVQVDREGTTSSRPTVDANGVIRIKTLAPSFSAPPGEGDDDDEEGGRESIVSSQKQLAAEDISVLNKMIADMNDNFQSLRGEVAHLKSRVPRAASDRERDRDILPASTPAGAAAEDGDRISALSNLVADMSANFERLEKDLGDLKARPDATGRRSETKKKDITPTVSSGAGGVAIDTPPPSPRSPELRPGDSPEEKQAAEIAALKSIVAEITNNSKKLQDELADVKSRVPPRMVDRASSSAGSSEPRKQLDAGPLSDETEKAIAELKNNVRRLETQVAELRTPARAPSERQREASDRSIPTTSTVDVENELSRVEERLLQSQQAATRTRSRDEENGAAAAAEAQAEVAEQVAALTRIVSGLNENFKRLEDEVAALGGDDEARPAPEARSNAPLQTAALVAEVNDNLQKHQQMMADLKAGKPPSLTTTSTVTAAEQGLRNRLADVPPSPEPAALEKKPAGSEGGGKSAAETAADVAAMGKTVAAMNEKLRRMESEVADLQARLPSSGPSRLDAIAKDDDDKRKTAGAAHVAPAEVAALNEIVSNIDDDIKRLQSEVADLKSRSHEAGQRSDAAASTGVAAPGAPGVTPLERRVTQAEDAANAAMKLVAEANDNLKKHQEMMANLRSGTKAPPALGLSGGGGGVEVVAAVDMLPALNIKADEGGIKSVLAVDQLHAAKIAAVKTAIAEISDNLNKLQGDMARLQAREVSPPPPASVDSKRTAPADVDGGGKEKRVERVQFAALNDVVADIGEKLNRLANEMKDLKSRERVPLSDDPNAKVVASDGALPPTSAAPTTGNGDKIVSELPSHTEEIAAINKTLWGLRENLKKIEDEVAALWKTARTSSNELPRTSTAVDGDEIKAFREQDLADMAEMRKIIEEMGDGLKRVEAEVGDLRAARRAGGSERGLVDVATSVSRSLMSTSSAGDVDQVVAEINEQARRLEGEVADLRAAVAARSENLSQLPAVRETDHAQAGAGQHTDSTSAAPPAAVDLSKLLTAEHASKINENFKRLGERINTALKQIQDLEKDKAKLMTEDDVRKLLEAEFPKRDPQQQRSVDENLDGAPVEKNTSAISALATDIPDSAPGRAATTTAPAPPGKTGDETPAPAATGADVETTTDKAASVVFTVERRLNQRVDELVAEIRQLRNSSAPSTTNGGMDDPARATAISFAAEQQLVRRIDQLMAEVERLKVGGPRATGEYLSSVSSGADESDPTKDLQNHVLRLLEHHKEEEKKLLQLLESHVAPLKKQVSRVVTVEGKMLTLEDRMALIEAFLAVDADDGEPPLASGTKEQEQEGGTATATLMELGSASGTTASRLAGTSATDRTSTLEDRERSQSRRSFAKIAHKSSSLQATAHLTQLELHEEGGDRDADGGASVLVPRMPTTAQIRASTRASRSTSGAKAGKEVGFFDGITELVSDLRAQVTMLEQDLAKRPLIDDCASKADCEAMEARLLLKVAQRELVAGGRGDALNEQAADVERGSAGTELQTRRVDDVQPEPTSSGRNNPTSMAEALDVSAPGASGPSRDSRDASSREVDDPAAPVPRAASSRDSLESRLVSALEALHTNLSEQNAKLTTKTEGKLQDLEVAVSEVVTAQDVLSQGANLLQEQIRAFEAIVYRKWNSERRDSSGSFRRAAGEEDTVERLTAEAIGASSTIGGVDEDNDETGEKKTEQEAKASARSSRYINQSLLDLERHEQELRQSIASAATVDLRPPVKVNVVDAIVLNRNPATGRLARVLDDSLDIAMEQSKADAELGRKELYDSVTKALDQALAANLSNGMLEQPLPLPNTTVSDPGPGGLAGPRMKSVTVREDQNEVREFNVPGATPTPPARLPSRKSSTFRRLSSLHDPSAPPFTFDDLYTALYEDLQEALLPTLMQMQPGFVEPAAAAGTTSADPASATTPDWQNSLALQSLIDQKIGAALRAQTRQPSQIRFAPGGGLQEPQSRSSDESGRGGSNVTGPQNGSEPDSGRDHPLGESQRETALQPEAAEEIANLVEEKIPQAIAEHVRILARGLDTRLAAQSADLEERLRNRTVFLEPPGRESGRNKLLRADLDQLREEFLILVKVVEWLKGELSKTRSSHGSGPGQKLEAPADEGQLQLRKSDQMEDLLELDHSTSRGVSFLQDQLEHFPACKGDEPEYAYAVYPWGSFRHCCGLFPFPFVRRGQRGHARGEQE